ncbi:ATP-grasp domain-containing protein [Helicobacter cinaedi]|uniref:ATP-grasp domain protein n=1 Tax=Helicobacter cinaedi CCUG 18818 = ATCC BAA-847 TaxID=537971 RepID=A0AAI8MM48_9HELI|nr:ATP-grasp domain-containing protein [Helicobacter cinaedi]EFR46593.1 ATP-grasp domain protein [Helicobacter cinaedi CCUG 18818 = ATCC BAA-847]QOQ89857.1 ATP-grasp domain-containing protein [Helicobacter cinaedi]BAM32050.1 hypothetical protein HCBAA847_0812 [Helicobacter cinaedi CCUG 18818 = ATCC BAA-847]
MKKLRILVTTIGGLTSPDCLLALRHNGEREVFLLGSDAFSGACGKSFVDKYELSPNSASDEVAFVEFIHKMVKQYDIDVIIPCGNDDNLALAKHKASFSISIMVGDYKDLLIAYDKAAVYEALSLHLPTNAPKYSIVSNYTDFLDSIHSLGYPHKKLVIKPRFGRGGRGVYILSDISKSDELFSSKPSNEMPLSFFESALQKRGIFDDLIIMEGLREPFVSAYSLCQNGQNLFTLQHIREWGNASQTYRGNVSYNTELEELCSAIIKIFNLTYTNNMELAYNEDSKLILFDLNPRLGASSGIDIQLGINFPYLALKLALGESITLDYAKIHSIDNQRFYRYFSQWWDNML